MRIAAVLIASVFYALALPPFDLSGFAWLVLVPFVLVLRGETVASAFRLGVLLGYACGWTVTWCFAEAAARYFQLPFPVAVAAVSLWYLVVCGLPFGVFSAGGVVVVRSFRGATRSVLLAALWVASEALRGRLMGQPWGLLGYTQHGHPPLIQIAAITGVYGVSFLLALGGIAMADCAAVLWATRDVRGALRRVGIPATLIASCWLGGTRLIAAAGHPDGESREIAIIQTNLAPALHWTRAYTQRQLSAHERATDSLPATAHPALIVWPENAVPRYLEIEPVVALRLAQLASRHGADLLFGGPRFTENRVYNSARLITASGKNGGHYDKQRLVLFAEEKPLLSPTSSRPDESPQEFSAGTRSGVLQSFARLGVSICHEIVHGDLIAQSVRDGAEVLVNIANDGWLDAGYEAARGQHLAMAVFRAVEARRYLLRAATSGTSAVIDPYGRVVASLGSDRPGVLTAMVAGERTLTPYVRFGDVFGVGCAALAASVILGARLARRIRMAQYQPLATGQ